MKTHYSCAELAALRMPDYPASERGFRKLVDREGWEFREVQAQGGKQGVKREYLPPAKVLKAIRAQEEIHAAAANPSIERRAMQAWVKTMNDFQAQEEAEAEARKARAEEVLKILAGGLTDREALSLKAHCEIAEGWKVWFVKHQPLKKSYSWEPYASAYNLAEVPVSQAVRAAFPEISPRSVQRWVGEYEKGNFEALVDRRNGADKKGKGVFSATPLLAAYAKKIMLERPGIKTGQLHALLGTAAKCDQTGEVLFQAPNYGQVLRFQKAWIEENQDLYLQATNPDAWKNSVMLAFGSYSADVTELNQRWEMDATPADWLLLDTDGKKRRYTVSVVVDVFSRRAIVVVSRTPKTETHCMALRLALLAWGVPRQIVTDNGADYQSEHFKRVLGSLGIEHKTTMPFSPEEKPHVERFIGTLNHSILELLPNFAGHNVADRKAIEARRSFADRLAKRGELVDFADVMDGSCTGETLQARINTWLAGSYEHNEHGGLGKGMTPFMKATAWTGEVRRITDERSLDILLARPAGNNGRRTLQKKGIKLDNTWFISPELATIQMGSVLDIYETSDLGRIVVYYRKNFLCIAEDPARTGNDRAEIAAKADAIQRERLKAARKRVKEETKGLPSTDDVLARHLNERAAAAGKLVQAPFGQAAAKHTSHGLQEAARAAMAMEAPQPSAAYQQLMAEAQRLMAETQPKAPVVTIPTAAAIPPANPGVPANPLDGMSDAERYDYWLKLNELVESGAELEDDLQRRFHKGFPRSSVFRAQAILAEGRKNAHHG